MQDCPSCRIELPDNAYFCSHCGHVLDATTTVIRAANKRQFPPSGVQPLDGSTITTLSRKVLDGGTDIQCCPSCEAELPGNGRFCSQCGYALEATTTVGGVTNEGQVPPTGVQPLDGSTIGSRISALSYKVLGKLPMPVQHVIAAVLTRAQDPKPEEFSTSHPRAAAPQVLAWGWLPMLALISTLGVLSA